MRVTDAIRIAAPPEIVWRVTAEVERWPEWTPTVTSVVLMTGPPLAVGSVARIKQPMQPEAEWVVTELVLGRRFAWETRRAGLRMVGRHELLVEGDATKNLLSVDAEGPLAALGWVFLRPLMLGALRQENRGLKRRCESLVA